jgi:hypothetical protein
MHTRTEIVDNAQKHPRPSSGRPFGCLDMPAYTASELICVQDHQKKPCATDIPNSETNRPARTFQLCHGS